MPDPYYGNDADFEHVLDLCEAAMPRLIREIRAALAEQPEDESEELLDEDADGRGRRSFAAALAGAVSVDRREPRHGVLDRPG